MNKIYITFGQCHIHRVNNHVLDKDCVAVINCKDEAEGRKLAMEWFDGKFCFSYYGEKQLEKLDMRYFPRGCVEINSDC